MSEDRILTKHPMGKRGVRITRAKYDLVRAAILECLQRKHLTHPDLTKCVVQRLKGKFEGSVSWYAETVKLDLEANNVIERTLKRKTEMYKLKKV